ncbi:RNA polymerase subunit sigma-24 [Mangrovactinospora gilvigrisea]|uniref:RNA polymerase subunit sigma-24 n=1 Tax=Mangrovactinospora gilvigrisea TaxID=1428644 RepID=A0A1J7B9F2_9ACTN|nr:ECF subfamily RNA polymerase sigma factor, BldN family [Mangrovactinospora gilvigrisea]OIV35295.1 RNA polymerase subunit sigma-24 [Mangrovactinospora gilvigrisea]
MYPHVGVDASGLATLRTLVVTHLHPVPGPALAIAGGPEATEKVVPARRGAHAARGPAVTHRATAQRASGTAGSTGTRARTGTGGWSRAGGRTARPPAADGEARRIMDLVEAAQSGETEAFGRLYDHYCDTVYRYIYYRVGSRATAEDLTSETFLRALRRISTFTWQGRDFGAWLVTIARNLVADHFKSSRFRLEVTTGEMLDANEVERSPEESVLESLSNEALLAAVRRLNPQQQECVTLRFLQGLSVAETARVMGKNEGAIKTLQYRAVRTLARLLPPDTR